ncbi:MULTISPECIES: PIG-L family deacetylase [unclassified Clostridioides]|uniref:PIG-L family deacetylase n=1 Tax=unclassified Clostridioides TaxID=2635829 RepID=UPI001D0C6BEC|nr:PIG-L family deacetylase [Clostridioides sp. ES-S-0001-03]MCC0694521.1 PIG-L family deacetylase [Clostridioides sp. ES-S-0048-02]
MENKKKHIVISILILFMIFIMAINLNGKLETPIPQSNSRKFKSNAVFYPQHQDDEVLWGGSAIVNAIKQCGTDNVYVVLVSDGSGVNVFRANTKFRNLTRKQKEELRNNEFKSALKELGVKQQNIIILADIDKKEGTHYKLMEKTILDFEHKFKGDVTHIAHHYKYDDHIMHRKNGAVLKKLKRERKIKDDLYFIKPKYVRYIPRNERAIYKATNFNDYSKVKSACYEYKVVNSKRKMYGIGYISAHSYFENLLNDPELTSVLSED